MRAYGTTTIGITSGITYTITKTVSFKKYIQFCQ